MTTGTIKQGDSAFVISTVMPSEWGNPTSVTASIIRDNGTYLLTDEAATIYAGDTLAADVKRFVKTCTLTTGTALEDGQVVNIGSDAQGWQELVVDSYTESTKALVLKKRFSEALVSGSFVKGRDMSITVDTSVDAWDFLGQVTIEWTPAGISEAPWVELYDLLKRTSAGAGLESRFAVEFEDYYSHVNGNFDVFEHSARDLVMSHIGHQNINLKKIIDSASYDYAVMTKIALNIAISHGAQFDSRFEKLSNSYDMQISNILSTYQWEDSNQDLVKDDSEVNKGSSIGYRRGR